MANKCFLTIKALKFQLERYEGRQSAGPKLLCFDNEGTISSQMGAMGDTSLLRPRESVFSFKLEDSLKPFELECLANQSGIAASAYVVPMYVAESMTSRVLLLVERPNGVD